MFGSKEFLLELICWQIDAKTLTSSPTFGSSVTRSSVRTANFSVSMWRTDMLEVSAVTMEPTF